VRSTTTRSADLGPPTPAERELHRARSEAIETAAEWAKAPGGGNLRPSRFLAAGQECFPAGREAGTRPVLCMMAAGTPAVIGPPGHLFYASHCRQTCERSWESPHLGVRRSRPHTGLRGGRWAS
jgi:hypothetical protein